MLQETNSILLSTAYLAPIQYYSKLVNFSPVWIEYQEHFPKQTYRNRCHIYGANGLLALSIPLKKHKEKTVTRDIKISYDSQWQKIHWKSIESAYRCSPFFEFYEDRLTPYYQKKNVSYLIDFNEALQTTILDILKVIVKLEYTEFYLKESLEKKDYRMFITPKQMNNIDSEFKLLPYIQVFQDKHGFISNLSIIDLLFNQGPSSLDFIL